MNEPRWLAGGCPRGMLGHLFRAGHFDRRRALFVASACCLLVREHLQSELWPGVRQVEEAAGGVCLDAGPFARDFLAAKPDSDRQGLAMLVLSSAMSAAHCGGEERMLEFVSRAVEYARGIVPGWAPTVIRCVFGNPFRPLAVRPEWLTPDVRAMALAAYEDRRPSGHLDPVRLAVLADAMEEVGADELAAHLRGGAHYAGCFAIEMILRR